MRVVSLIASATEIVCALGQREALVGISHECDFPPDVTSLPRLTRPLLDPTLSSARIDGQVLDLLRQGLSIYDVDAAALGQLRPDVVVTQTQCEVCAVSLDDVERALGRWTGGPRPKVVSLAPDRLEDVWGDVGRVAAALGVPAAGEELVGRLRARVEAVRAAAGRAAAGRRPRVALVEWIDPLMVAGNWMPELVELAGGECLLGQAGRHAPRAALADLVRADPDVIAVLPCGFDLARTRAEMPALTGRPAWAGLRAVRAGRVALCDGNALFNRPGPRLVESLEVLAEVLHPGLDHGHRGRFWEPL